MSVASDNVGLHPVVQQSAAPVGVGWTKYIQPLISLSLELLHGEHLVSRSSQCSTTGVTKACLWDDAYKRILAANRKE